MKYTSVSHWKIGHNVQQNWDSVESWQDYCKENTHVIWSKLFKAADGELIGRYPDASSEFAEFSKIISEISSVKFTFVEGQPVPEPRSGKSVAVVLGIAWKVFKAAKRTGPSRIAEQRLDRPARVNSTNFMTGVPVRMVVEAAQRYYDYRQENPPEKDGELQQKFLAAIDSAKRQRITEQDAREILESYWNSHDDSGDWLKSEDGRALLDKLNKA